MRGGPRTALVVVVGYLGSSVRHEQPYTGSSFTGAFGDGPSYSRPNQASDLTDNHAIIATGKCH
jgi:hypothetical protein